MSALIRLWYADSTELSLFSVYVPFSVHKSCHLKPQLHTKTTTLDENERLYL